MNVVSDYSTMNAPMKTWCLRWLVFGGVLFFVGVGIEGFEFGLLVGVSTFFSGILLTHTMLNPGNDVFDWLVEGAVALLKGIIPQRFPGMLRITGLSVAIFLYVPIWPILLVVLGLHALRQFGKTPRGLNEKNENEKAGVGEATEPQSREPSDRRIFASLWECDDCARLFEYYMNECPYCEYEKRSTFFGPANN